ncbi:MAG: glycosyltransferase family 39 protein [Caldilineaceae bacterium]|nr:glycosyltransferase family 39 protein [Caldilineaceae bacterium]
MNTPPLSPKERIGLITLLLVATWLYTWGLQRNLPYTSEADENIFVERAVAMASSGDLNPGWFGNPGSTLFYPLMLIYRLWYWGQGAPSPDLASWFFQESWPFYFLARLLTVAYALLALPLTYLIGRRVFTPTISMIGVALLLSYPTLLAHVKTVRTDSAGLLFTGLIIWCCLQVYAKPTVQRQLLAGATIGLGIASRYFLVLFTPLLLWLTWQAGRKAGPVVQDNKTVYSTLICGLLMIGVSFALSTPYFFLDYQTAWHNLVTEGRSTHPGADGLSYWQNFIWYFRQMAQQETQWLQSGLAMVGLAVILRQRQLLPLTLLGSILLFLAGISLASLHWLRWVLPLFPLAALICAQGIVASVTWLTRGQSHRLQVALLIMVTLAALTLPGLRAVRLSIRDANPSTRLLARQWLQAQLAGDDRVIQEPYTALLAEDPRVVTTGYSLGTDQTLADYQQAGYTYLVISSYMYDRFLAEPTRYPREVAFYESLFQANEPLVTFRPSWARGGPTLQVYAMPTAAQSR